MLPDPGNRTSHRFGVALIGLGCLDLAALANVTAGRVFPGSLVTTIIADVLAAAFVGCAAYCIGLAARGRVPRWYSNRL